METMQKLESYQMAMEKPAETSNYLTDQSICSEYYPESISPKGQLLSNNFNRTQKQPYSTLNNKDFLSRCEEFIMEHSTTKSKETKKKPVNFSTTKKSISPIKECEKCKIYYEREMEWLKEKLNLERVVKELEGKLSMINAKNINQEKEFIDMGIQAIEKSETETKLSQLQIINKVFTFSITEQFESYLTKSRSFSEEETMSTIQSEISPSEITTDREVFFESLKSYNEKLQSTESENKYLKIENYTLMKAKEEKRTEIETIKREMQKTRSERDMFKKKLIAINDKQHVENKRESNDHVRLKQRKVDNKNNQELFELSLTDSQSINKEQNSEKNKVKKVERPQFIIEKQK